MTEQRNIDPLTGLPELPEGHFWRLTHGLLTSRYLLIQLRRRMWFGSRQVEYSVLNKTDVTVEAVRTRARYALEEYMKSLEPKADYRHLLGDYPPKRLPEATE